MPDCDALRFSNLRDLIENLPAGYVSIGDAAYIASEHLVPIFLELQPRMLQMITSIILLASVELELRWHWE